MAARIDAVLSAIGMDSQTPIAPKWRGSRISSGTRKSIWRVSDMKIAFLGLPIYWKKLLVTIWNPTIGKTIRTVRSKSEAKRS